MDWLSEGLSEINYWHVLISGVVAMVVGYIWYSDWLFGKRWRKETGIKMDKVTADEMQRSMLQGFVVTLVMVSFLYGVILASGTTEVWDAAWLAALLGLGFSATAIFMNNTYQKKSPVLSLIDSGYQIAALMAAALTIMWLI